MELRGRTFLITRAAAQARDLGTGLEALGATVLEAPALEIVPVEDTSAIDRAAAALATYDWVVFTSTNAVEMFLSRVSALRLTCTTPIAVIGSATARKLEDWSLRASLIPPTFRAEGLLDSFPADLQGVRILMPRAESAREILPDALRRRGAAVDVVPVYRTVKSSTGLGDLKTCLRSTKIDAVVFLSPSAIRFVVEELADDAVMLARLPLAVIGPVAADALRELGFEPTIQPPVATVADLIESLRRYFSSPAKSS